MDFPENSRVSAITIPAVNVMAEYANVEKADMHLVYGATSGNARAAQALYAERFPNRRVPDCRLYERLYRQLRETGTFQSTWVMLVDAGQW